MVSGCQVKISDSSSGYNEFGEATCSHESKAAQVRDALFWLFLPPCLPEGCLGCSSASPNPSSVFRAWHRAAPMALERDEKMNLLGRTPLPTASRKAASAFSACLGFALAYADINALRK